MRIPPRTFIREAGTPDVDTTALRPVPSPVMKTVLLFETLSKVLAATQLPENVERLEAQVGELGLDGAGDSSGGS